MCPIWILGYTISSEIDISSSKKDKYSQIWYNFVRLDTCLLELYSILTTWLEVCASPSIEI